MRTTTLWAMTSAFALLACGSEPSVTPDAGAPPDGAMAADASDPPRDAATAGEDGSVPTDGATDASTPSGCPTDGGGALGVIAVHGTVEDGREIVVCGDGFGALGPTIAFFDDMESGVAGAPVGADDPRIGAWSAPAGVYVDDASRSGGRAMLLADTDETGGRGVSSELGVPDPSGRFGLRHFDEVFLHLSIRDLGDFPGNDSSPTSFSSDSSAKDAWMMFGSRGDNYDYSCSQGTCNGNDLVFATHTGRGAFKMDGNNTSTSWWLPAFWEFQAWNTMSTHLRIDRSDPYGSSTGIFEHVSRGRGYTRSEYGGQILQDLDGIPPEWDRIKIGAWYRTAGDVRRVLDDLYVAIGPGAAARVEIADAPRVEDATRIAVSPVVDWSPTRIAATVRLGDLDAGGEPLYLFVVTADDERSAGYPLTP